jgi:hypothetical protein
MSSLQGSNMTRTIVASATREVIIGFDQPFCVIGERINPTGRKKLAAEMVRAISTPSSRTRWNRSRPAPPCSTSMPA